MVALLHARAPTRPLSSWLVRAALAAFAPSALIAAPLGCDEGSDYPACEADADCARGGSEYERCFSGSCRLPTEGEECAGTPDAFACEGDAECVGAGEAPGLCTRAGEAGTTCSTDEDCSTAGACFGGTCDPSLVLDFGLPYCKVTSTTSMDEPGVFEPTMCWIRVDASVATVLFTESASSTPDAPGPGSLVAKVARTEEPFDQSVIVPFDEEPSNGRVPMTFVDRSGITRDVTGTVDAVVWSYLHTNVSVDVKLGSYAQGGGNGDIVFQTADGPVGMFAEFSAESDGGPGVGDPPDPPPPVGHACRTVNGHICTELVSGDAAAYDAQCALDGVPEESCPDDHILGCENADGSAAGDGSVIVNVYWYPEACGVEIVSGQGCINGSQVGSGC